MNARDRELRAAEYVLGILGTAERQAFEASLARDLPLREAVARWENDLSPLLESAPEIAPSAGLWNRIEDEITRTESVQNAIQTVHASDDDWVTFLPGIEKKQLHRDPAQKIQSYLLRFDPGATLPAHGHKIAEECIVLEGSVALAGERLSAGDFQLLPVGSRHVEMTSPNGAVVYVRGETDGPVWDFYRFARNLGAFFGR